MAKLQYEADGDISPDRFVAALTDFSVHRPDWWPNLSTTLFKVHELGDTWADVTEGSDDLGGVWARERYDWSEPGHVRLTLVEAASFKPGTVIDYRVSGRGGGGCHVVVDFQRIATTLKGRFVGAALEVVGERRFASDLRETLRRLATDGPDAARTGSA
jgi:hypothetical protein